MKIFAWTTTFCVALSLALYAHDPGLSTASLTLQDRNIEISQTFAPNDVEWLVSIDDDESGIISDAEWQAGSPKLEEFATKCFDVRVDGQVLLSSHSRVERDSNDNIHLRTRLQHGGGSQLAVRSLCLSGLPRGHRQFVTILSDEQVLSEQLLNARNDSFEVALLSTKAGSAKSISDGGESMTTIFTRFMLLGVEHLLIGFDHLLFVLAIVLVGGTLRKTITVITAFSVGHSVTLALAALDVVGRPASIVEPLIAASIVYVGLENLVRRTPRHRAAWTFGFELVHGLGFAAVLSGLRSGAPSSQFASLGAFNLGVEIGQAAIAAVALPIIIWLRRYPGLSWKLTAVTSLLIACAGGFWLVERTVGV
jgi:hydrogenase/urease accessory protein HupE